ncbi:MAG: putative metal-dependent hydrolase [Acidobacteriia bacterium]|nr:putative metal-dependent hydrolase [Terriglobia bacterium]
MADLQYPVGRSTKVTSLSPAQRTEYIEQIAAAPELLRLAVAGLDDGQLDSPYRPGGWTVRQVVHHVPESHMNAYVRCKLALTEDVPTIKPYDQARWSETPDTRAPVDVSLALLAALHRKWVLLLRGLGPDDFARRFNHPESGINTLDSVLAMYSWHGRHHTAHITTLRERMGW